MVYLIPIYIHILQNVQGCATNLSITEIKYLKNRLLNPKYHSHDTSTNEEKFNRAHGYD